MKIFILQGRLMFFLSLKTWCFFLITLFFHFFFKHSSVAWIFYLFFLFIFYFLFSFLILIFLQNSPLMRKETGLNFDLFQVKLATFCWWMSFILWHAKLFHTSINSGFIQHKPFNFTKHRCVVVTFFFFFS